MPYTPYVFSYIVVDPRGTSWIYDTLEEAATAANWSLGALRAIVQLSGEDYAKANEVHTASK